MMGVGGSLGDLIGWACLLVVVFFVIIIAWMVKVDPFVAIPTLVAVGFGLRALWRYLTT